MFHFFFRIIPTFDRNAVQEHFNPDKPNIHLIFEEHHDVLEISSKSAFAAAEKEPSKEGAWKGSRIVWTVWKVHRVTTQTVGDLIWRSERAEGLKVASTEQKCSGSVRLPWKSTVNIV